MLFIVNNSQGEEGVNIRLIDLASCEYKQEGFVDNGLITGIINL